MDQVYRASCCLNGRTYGSLYTRERCGSNHRKGSYLMQNNFDESQCGGVFHRALEVVVKKQMMSGQLN